jgi:DNA-binding XRE family transcriptional regulator
MKNEKLQARRIAKGHTHASLALAANVPQSTYSYYERGAREAPVSNAIRIARALKCKVEDIF